MTVWNGALTSAEFPLSEFRRFCIGYWLIESRKEVDEARQIGARM